MVGGAAGVAVRLSRRSDDDVDSDPVLDTDDMPTWTRIAAYLNPFRSAELGQSLSAIRRQVFERATLFDDPKLAPTLLSGEGALDSLVTDLTGAVVLAQQQSLAQGDFDEGSLNRLYISLDTAIGRHILRAVAVTSSKVILDLWNVVEAAEKLVWELASQRKYARLIDSERPNDRSVPEAVRAISVPR
jgi:hypothetical protein